MGLNVLIRSIFELQFKDPPMTLLCRSRCYVLPGLSTNQNSSRGGRERAPSGRCGKFFPVSYMRASSMLGDRCTTFGGEIKYMYTYFMYKYIYVYIYICMLIYIYIYMYIYIYIYIL